MFTQVELISTKDEVAVYWLDHNLDEHKALRAGLGVKIVEADSYWRINRIFMTLKNLADLPVKHRIGTVIELN
jgi:hypothetical protein